jgi:hypothetical protein
MSIELPEGLTTTENGAIMHSSSSNPIVDFFMLFVRGVSDEFIETHMQTCWLFDPVKTIALIFNARDRENGKKEKNISNRALIWLKRNKFNTYAKNLHTYVTKYGRWKDVAYIALKHKTHGFEAKLFADQLRVDKDKLADPAKCHEITLCAKWVSSEHDKIDRECNLAHDIAEELFPDDPKKMEKFRKEFLSPLRKQIDIIERYMSANKWKDIKYDRVPAVASKRLRHAFEKHDPTGYAKFLQQVASGEKKIKVTGLLPHELVAYYLQNNVKQPDETIELQWKQLVENIKSKGILDNMLAIVDTSGSMTREFYGIQPIYVSISLGILIAECNTGFFHKKIISFHSNPTPFIIKGNTLFEQVKHISDNLPAGYDTNFEEVFNYLIKSAQKFNIPPGNMPNKIICLSDMQFNEAATEKTISDETLHQTIIKKYENTGYNPPKFIYWNLSSEHNAVFPVQSLTENVAMISGFSEQLLKVFMNNDDFNAEKIVYDILKEYEPFVEIDQEDMPVLQSSEFDINNFKQFIDTVVQ